MACTIQEELGERSSEPKTAEFEVPVSFQTDMASVSQFQLTGWKAVAVLLFFVAIVGVRLLMVFQAIPDEGREAVQAWLVKDYEGLGPKAAAQIVSDYREGLPVQPPARPPAVPEVQFVSLNAHGSPYRMIVRAEVSVNGGPPPDGRPVRYLLLTTKFGGGWMVTSESTAYSYYEVLVE